MSSLEEVRDGLNIFIKYRANSIDTQHDTIMVLCETEISEEDKLRLLNLSWWIDYENDCWSIFI